MRLRELNVGCFGGGTGLPSLLGGLKNNPWLNVNAVVTMFDSGGSSGQLRDELGVLPPGDILKCALALARNAREARRVLLARLPTLEHARLGGHTGGNLLLSMMQRYSGDFLDAIDGLRALLGCRGRVWPVSVQPASVCAEYGDGSVTRGEVEVDAGQSSGRFVRRIWLEPPVSIHPAVAKAIAEFDAVIIGPGSFYTSLMPIFLVRGVAEALGQMKGPVILIANLLTEGRGMAGFTASRRRGAHRGGDPPQSRRRASTNMKWPSPQVLGRYALEHKEPLAPGTLPEHVRARRRRVLDERHRAARSPATRLRRVERAFGAAARRRRERAGLKTCESPRSASSDQFINRIKASAAHHPLHGARVADVSQRIARDECKVGELPGFDRAQLVVDPERPRGVDGRRLQRLKRREARMHEGLEFEVQAESVGHERRIGAGENRSAGGDDRLHGCAIRLQRDVSSRVDRTLYQFAQRAGNRRRIESQPRIERNRRAPRSRGSRTHPECRWSASTSSRTE